MNFNMFLFTFVIGFFFYSWGYKAIGFFVFVLAVLLLFSDSFMKKKSKYKAPAGYEMGEPIIIESTRDAPFRIAKGSWFKIKAKGTTEQPGGKFTKAEYKTFGAVNSFLGKKMRNLLDSDYEG